MSSRALAIPLLIFYTAPPQNTSSAPPSSRSYQSAPPSSQTSARGPILQQDDLIAALANEPEPLLRGAALDVTDPEPLPPSSPLWTLDNVTITPHVSGYSANYTERSFDILRRNLNLLEESGDFGGLINVVDKERGY